MQQEGAEGNLQGPCLLFQAVARLSPVRDHVNVSALSTLPLLISIRMTGSAGANDFSPSVAVTGTVARVSSAARVMKKRLYDSCSAPH
jgi:hypothetical protein